MTRTKTRALANNPNSFVSVLDYGADSTGNNPTETTEAIQNAIDDLKFGQCLYFPPGEYKINDQLLISGKNNITLMSGGGATGTAIRWQAAADDSKAYFKILKSSYVTIKGLFLNTDGSNQPGYGIRITSEGTGVTQGNVVSDCTIRGVSEYGIYLGNTDDTDTNVDLNQFIRCYVDLCGKGALSIHGSNTNQTVVDGGSYAIGSVCAIEVGTHTRGVTVRDILPIDTDDNATALGVFLVRKEHGDKLHIQDVVCELYRHSFLYAEASEDGPPQIIGKSRIVLDNVSTTCDFVNNGSDENYIIQYLQHGSLLMNNCYMAGRSDRETYILYNTPNFAGPGSRTFEIKSSLFYQNLNVQCPSINNTNGAETAFTASYRDQQTGSNQTASKVITRDDNVGIYVNGFVAFDGRNTIDASNTDMVMYNQNNIQKVVRQNESGAGPYYVYFRYPMADENYCVNASATAKGVANGPMVDIGDRTTEYVEIRVFDEAGNYILSPYIAVSILKS